MANYDVNTAPAATLTGTEKLYLIGKQTTTPNALKTFMGNVTPTQLATEQARILALETSQGTQDATIATKAATTALTAETTRATAAEATLTTNLATEVTNRTTADALLLPKTDVLDTYAGGAAKAASAERAKDLDTRLTAEVAARTAAEVALAARVTSLEGRDLPVGTTVRTGTFAAVIGKIEPFSTASSNATCNPPATGTLTDGVTFGVQLNGVQGAGFVCVIDFQTAGQTLQGRTGNSGADSNVTIRDEITPFTVRWSAAHAQWFVLR
jgi:hypothetical protein